METPHKWGSEDHVNTTGSVFKKFFVKSYPHFTLRTKPYPQGFPVDCEQLTTITVNNCFFMSRARHDKGVLADNCVKASFQQIAR